MTLYHESFTSAIQEALKTATNKGLVINEDDIFTYITAGDGRPKNGNTFRCSLEINNSKKYLHIQVADLQRMTKSYELNSYIM